MSRESRLHLNDKVNGYVVTTLELAVPYADGSRFETLIMGEVDLLRWRFSNELAAIAGHDQAIEHARDLPTYERKGGDAPF